MVRYRSVPLVNEATEVDHGRLSMTHSNLEQIIIGFLLLLRLTPGELVALRFSVKVASRP